ncbi:MAG: hypothetical protein GY805_35345, partial [Chloroflexi bacterium]|nr:hypothetical protein [Chloroflexota bacterium]
MAEDIFARLQSAKSDEEREWLLLEMNLAQLPPDVQEMVWAAAVPHWFDIPYLAAVLDMPAEKRTYWEELTALNFVESFPGRGFNIHERTRHMLLNRLWQENQDNYRELSQRAAAYCAKQDQEDPTWRIEWIYHLLIAQPEEGASQLQNNGWTWQNSPNYAYDLVEAMAAAAHEHADGHRLDQRGEGWTLFWQAHLDKIYSRNRSARQRLLAIQITQDEDQYLSADAIQALGEVHVRLSEYEAARERYEEALPIYEAIGARLGQANCIQALGDVHVSLS